MGFEFSIFCLAIRERAREDRAPGTPRDLHTWIPCDTRNDPLLKSPWLSSLIFNFMFFARRDPVVLRFQKNYARCIPNHSGKMTTGITIGRVPFVKY